MKLTWDGIGQKMYNYGVSQGVLFLLNPENNKWEGTAWNGLSNVTESPEGGDVNEVYADNILYASLRGAEKFGGSIEAYTTPKEWDECIGQVTVMPGVTIGQQTRRMFCLAYRSEIGSDTNPNAGYDINIIYNATANASEMSHDTIEDSIDIEPLSFDFDCVPVQVTGHKATSRIKFNSLTTTPAVMAKLERIIFGTDDEDSYLPVPDDLFQELGE